MMQQIIGKGGFAREVSAYLSNDGIPFKMFEHECEGIRDDMPTMIAIGDPAIRKNIAERFNHLSFYKFDIGKSYGTVNIGEGAIICPGTILTTGITIGRHVIINLNCTVGHDCVIGDFVTISPGVNISGNVIIGSYCYIGTNAVIRDKVKVCENVVIGAGGVVVKDIAEPGVYVGNPVKKIVCSVQ